MRPGVIGRSYVFAYMTERPGTGLDWDAQAVERLRIA
jgi:hypothetical protein